MGNQPSSGEGGGVGSTTSNKVRGFMGKGLLGLSKAELDERCRPSGLYPSCQWEDKAVRKLIGDGKLSARLRGTENRSSPTDRECPICFLQYKEVNTTKCCSAFICTECYLQVRPQKAKSPSCPFCNHSKFSVTVAQAMNAEAMLLREETEQRVIEAKIREQQSQQNSNSPNGDNKAGGAAEKNSFGSSLEQNERIATLRARSSSLSDQQENFESIPEDVLRESFAMTPEERRMLEDEMRAQHSHPLSLRLEAEAEERRIQNEQEFLRNNPTHAFLEQQRRYRSARASGSRTTGGAEPPRRNWNQIVEAFERGGHGEVNSLDDLVVLEAAMILSMEEEGRRRGSNSAAPDGAAEPFDANRHANEGFPLVRSILSGRQSGTATRDEDQIQNLANSIYNSRRRSGRNSLLRAAYGAGNNNNTNNANAPNNNNNTANAPNNNQLDTAMDTAGLLMRGISEDDQIAMAIAASLQEQSQPNEEEGGEENETSGGENDDAEGETSAQEPESSGNTAEELQASEDAAVEAALESAEATSTEATETAPEEPSNTTEPTNAPADAGASDVPAESLDDENHGGAS
ncbi:May negatively regulate the SNF1 kinase (By similarity) [Seminavis robusta]|uniref:May negatively regulate the SNF1 kinase By similarity n=1 Tax=Seminavis robusta TaxID=568900 RepID=A0A9N8DIC3_9STRA|nr:May negatively regulate the SNF1 kinase (By similarity) [Seminavis robusta]|eukprot:Sro79_g042730.1 May negatively regulate the SNF1 kinase (By similarity) (575) ;mRNA; f:58310-60387